MVKRPKSPETAEDEKYFTIYQPYPLNANWEITEDKESFSRWIAGCIGTAPLYALHYKPKARGMVLLEIDKSYPHSDRLLGEHRCSEFLRNPSQEEKGRVSQIFHSFYTTGREAQKDGWKRIHVEGSWFKDWSPNNLVFQNPYPNTHWCPTPPEDRTNKPLCRPLPVAVKSPPVTRVAPPVVGSAAWTSSKAAPSQNTPPVLKGAWAAKQKSAPAAQHKTNVPLSPVRDIPRHIASTRLAAANLPPNAWNTPIIQNEPTSPRPASTPSQAQAPAYPPGLGPRIISSGAAVPATLAHLSDSNGSGSSPSSGFGSGSQSSWDDTAIKNLADRLEETATVSLSPSQDQALYGAPALDEEDDDPVGISPDLHVSTLQPWERAHSGKAEYTYLVADDGNDGGNLWAEENKSKPLETPICPVHKILCKKGICKEMSKIIRDQERKKKEEERKSGKGRNGGQANRRNNNGGDGGRRAQGSSNENVSTNGSVDGFSTVARGQGRANGHKNSTVQGRNRGQENATSVGGGGYGRNRGNSVSSNSESVGGPARSESGWTDASNW